MGLLIKGATGQTAEVNAQGQLVAEAMVKSAFAKATENGDAYSWTAVTANLGAGGTALRVVNQSRDRLLCITKVYTWSDVSTIIKIHCPVPAAWDGTATVGVNLNRHSIKTADASAAGNDTVNALVDAQVLISLHTNESDTDQFGVSWDFEGALILGYDNCVAVDIVADSGAFNCTVIAYYIDA